MNRKVIDPVSVLFFWSTHVILLYYNCHGHLRTLPLHLSDWIQNSIIATVNKGFYLAHHSLSICMSGK